MLKLNYVFNLKQNQHLYLFNNIYLEFLKYSIYKIFTLIAINKFILTTLTVALSFSSRSLI